MICNGGPKKKSSWGFAKLKGIFKKFRRQYVEYNEIKKIKEEFSKFWRASKLVPGSAEC